MRTILLRLEVSDFYGFPVCIEIYGRCPYKEDTPIFGTDNVFEYYFEQPSELSVSEVKKEQYVFVQNDYSGTFSLNKYDLTEEGIEHLAMLYKKYIHLNSRTRRYIESSFEIFSNKEDILGVHVRGTDFKNGFCNHPVAALAEEYIEQVIALKENYKFKYIFLATDDKEILEQFQKKFTSNLLFYEDTARGSGKVGVHSRKTEREHSSYMLGLEVLRDAYTLASCDGLLAGLSQVSYAARYINKAEFEPYKKVVILDHGINH
jgi:hypothetical protein